MPRDFCKNFDEDLARERIADRLAAHDPSDQRPDADDLPHTFWHCEHCHAQNSCLDGECQYCEGEAAHILEE